MSELTADIENIIFLGNKPKIAIATIPILAQNFTWAKTPGITPYSTQITIPKKFSAAMRSLSNPVDIKIEMRGGIGVHNFGRNNIIEIKKVFLHEPKEISEFEERWQISDTRFQFRGQKCFFSYNETRIKNEIGIANPTQLKASIDTNPAALRAPFDRFALGRYVAPSVDITGNPLPFTQIIKKELAKKGVNIAVHSNLVQDDYVMENIRAEGEDFYSCISGLLAKARLQIGIRLDGSLELYSVDFFDDVGFQSLLSLGNQQKADLGTFYREDKKKTRPRKVIVRFEKMKETMIALTSVPNPAPRQPQSSTGTPRKAFPTQALSTPVTSPQQIAGAHTIGCINVVKAQFIPLAFLGLYNVGEYVEIGEYLSLFGLTENFLQKTFFGDLLRFEISQFLNPAVLEEEALAGAIASNILNSYRQLFMIDPYWIDRIKFWEAKRVVIVDQFSGYRPRSPLFQDYTISPRVRELRQVRGQTNNKLTKSVRVSQFDPNRQKETIGTIQVVDPQLGVFSVSYPPVADTTVLPVIPSALAQDVLINPTFGGSPFLSGAELSEDHTMETLVSVVWNYDSKENFDSGDLVNKSGKYHEIEYDFSSASPQFPEGQGPDVVFLSSREFARFDRDDKLVNPTIISAVADAEVAKIMNRFRDRIAGELKLPIFVDFPLMGNLSSIVYSFSPTEGISTYFDATQPPFDPQVEQAVPDNVRAYLYRQIDLKTGP